MAIKTYQKILSEAIDELKEKEFKTLYEDTSTPLSDRKFVKDTTIDTDFELLFPDDYVNNITERLNLYTKLNELKNEAELQKFEKELLDRFGELPEPAVDLLNSVRIKWIAISMGLERVVMKHKKMVGYFVADQQSSFYQSSSFSKVLDYVQTHPKKVTMKEKQTRNGLRLLLTFEGVSSVDKALQVLEPFSI